MKKRGEQGKRGEEKWDIHGRSLSGLGAKPHELQLVGEKTDGIGPTTLQHSVLSKPQLQN